MKVSVISTLKNEESSVGEFLNALLSQSLMPDEIILADGGSTDRTAEIVQGFVDQGAPIKFIVVPGVNRAVGRNTAVSQAKNNIIASTDLGCRPDRDWLKNITAPFEEDPSIAVVAGFFTAIPANKFERYSTAFMLSDVNEINPETWLPSSRSVTFRKEVWEKVGGYPEWLPFNEDTPFDLRLKKAGYKFKFASDAVVYWYPRSNLRQFFQQNYWYSRGDGQAQLYLLVNLRKILIYTIGAILFLLGFKWFLCWILLAIGLVTYLSKYCLRVFRKVKKYDAFLITPILVFAIDMAQIFGFLRGLLDRLAKSEYRQELFIYPRK